jgi:hypothetical protein
LHHCSPSSLGYLVPTCRADIFRHCSKERITRCSVFLLPRKAGQRDTPFVVGEIFAHAAETS